MDIENPQHKGLDERVKEIADFMHANYGAEVKSRFRKGMGNTDVPEYSPDNPQEYARGLVVIEPSSLNPDDPISMNIYPTLFGKVDTSANNHGSVLRHTIPRRRFTVHSFSPEYAVRPKSVMVEGVKYVFDMEFMRGRPTKRVAHFCEGNFRVASIDVDPQQSVAKGGAVMVMPYHSGPGIGLLKMAYEIELNADFEWEIHYHGRAHNLYRANPARQLRRSLYGRGVYRKGLSS